MSDKQKAMAELLYISLIKWADTSIDVLGRLGDRGVRDEVIEDLTNKVNELVDKKLAEAQDSDVVMDEIERIHNHITNMKNVYRA